MPHDIVTKKLKKKTAIWCMYDWWHGHRTL